MFRVDVPNGECTGTNAAYLSTVSTFPRTVTKGEKCGAISGSRVLFSLSLHARTALHCSTAVHFAARRTTHINLAKDVGEGGAMTVAIDAQQPGCTNLNVTTATAAAADDDDDKNDVVDMHHSSSLSSPIEGFVVQKWMRDRTRATAPHATAGVS